MGKMLKAKMANFVSNCRFH